MDFTQILKDQRNSEIQWYVLFFLSEMKGSLGDRKTTNALHLLTPHIYSLRFVFFKQYRDFFRVHLKYRVAQANFSI